MKGLSAPKIEGKFSLRASTTGEVVMDEVFVRRRTCCPACRDSKAVQLSQQSALRHRMGRHGAAEFCWHAARNSALERKQFGKPLAANQLVQISSRTCKPKSRWGLSGVLRLGRLMDDGQAAPEMVSLLKRNYCGKALDIARLARECTAATAWPTNTMSSATC